MVESVGNYVCARVLALVACFVCLQCVFFVCAHVCNLWQFVASVLSLLTCWLVSVLCLCSMVRSRKVTLPVVSGDFLEMVNVYLGKHDMPDDAIIPATPGDTSDSDTSTSDDILSAMDHSTVCLLKQPSWQIK